MAQRACTGCGASFTISPRERHRRKWCSEACRVRAHRQANPAYVARGRELDAARRRATYVPAAPHALTCVMCGTPFEARTGLAKFCSSPCRFRSAYLGRRGRKAGAEREPYTTLDIANRDGWNCGLCLEPIDRDLTYPDGLSASVDHRTPLARGGDDTLANVHLAHLICNKRKGHRPQPDMGAHHPTGRLDDAR